MTPRASGPRAGLRRRVPSGPGGGVRPIGPPDGATLPARVPAPAAGGAGSRQVPDLTGRLRPGTGERP
ncbi:hypothetical protein [Amycolatopsis rubida]|uniref:Uncharacterized protein n=1 Tax=Amycolatopsis rubida TaxID=112413 RepID=A0A1I6AJE2_9PSEU|nr:hypothetical protein [Amycolatopsis rubida]SFQ68617.1 hypothetical protein SAMN05421854_11963 [Amycolatopsis rubida]